MMNMRLWTVVASLFCTLALTDALHDAGRRLQLAGMGNPVGVQSSLAEVAGRMGVAAPQSGVIPVAAKTPVLLENPTPALDKVAAVSNWVLHGESKSKAITLVGPVAKLMGLNEGTDIGAIASNYANDDQGFYFLVLPGRAEVVLGQRYYKTHRTIYYLVRDGESPAIVLRDGQAPLEVVSGAEYQKSGKAILDYFYGRLPPSGVASSAAPSKS